MQIQTGVHRIMEMSGINKKNCAPLLLLLLVGCAVTATVHLIFMMIHHPSLSRLLAGHSFRVEQIRKRDVTTKTLGLYMVYAYTEKEEKNHAK